MKLVRSRMRMPSSGPLAMVLTGSSAKNEIKAWSSGRNRTEPATALMQLHLSSWPEIGEYLATSKAILIPIGSTEQHGPNGLLGTDCIAPETIARRAGDEAS